MSLKDANARTICLFAYQSLRISSNSSCRWCVDPEGMRKDIRAVALNINNTCRFNLSAHREIMEKFPNPETGHSVWDHSVKLDAVFMILLGWKY